MPLDFFFSLSHDLEQGAHLLLSVRALARDRDRNAFSFHQDISLVPQDRSSRDNSDVVQNVVNGHRESPTEAHELMWWPTASHQSTNARRSEADAATRPSGVTSWMDEWNAE